MDIVKMIEIKGLCHWLGANGQFKKFFQDIWYIFMDRLINQICFSKKKHISNYIYKSHSNNSVKGFIHCIAKRILLLIAHLAIKKI